MFFVRPEHRTCRSIRSNACLLRERSLIHVFVLAEFFAEERFARYLTVAEIETKKVSQYALLVRGRRVGKNTSKRSIDFPGSHEIICYPHTIPNNPVHTLH